MIQQAINKGLSLAALVYSHTPAFKKGVRKKIPATEGDTSSETVKARTEEVEKEKQVAEYAEPALSEPATPSSTPEIMSQRAQEHMAEKQTIKQRNFKNKSLRQKKKHGVI